MGEFCSTEERIYLPNISKKIRVNELFEGLFVEVNLRSKKWLLGCSYNPHKVKVTSHFCKVSTALVKFCTDYENIILLSDSKVEV